MGSTNADDKTMSKPRSNRPMTATDIRKDQQVMYVEIDHFEKLWWDRHRAGVKWWIAWQERERKKHECV